MGLRQHDLKNLVDNVFEIDSYKSKMGVDENIVVLSFSVKGKDPANDLVNFVESGYGFVLDADVSSGEQDDGSYKVFVEIERTSNISKEINEMLEGLSNLADINNFKYRYYKSFMSTEATEENLLNSIPDNPTSYNSKISESKMNNFQNFFDKSFVESVQLDSNNLLTVKKVYADPLVLKVVDFGPTTDILESIEDKINMNDFAEILFCIKYIGDYNITKFGANTLTLENRGHTLVVERT